MRESSDQKSIQVFAGKVVRKDLVRKVKVGANIRVIVLEYLRGKYCAGGQIRRVRFRNASFLSGNARTTD
jgi:predicted ATP-dependent Lon-type protease